MSHIRNRSHNGARVLALAVGFLSAVCAPAQGTWNAAVTTALSGCLAPGPEQRVIVASSLLDVTPGAIPAGNDSRSWIAWLADRSPHATGEFGGGSVSGAFKIALDYHESALPNRTPAEVRAIRRAHKTLTRRRAWLIALFIGKGPVQPSRKLIIYRTYARQYRDAEYVAATAASAAEKTKAESQLRDAEDAWKALGFKTEIEDALDNLNMETASDPQAHWATVGQAFSRANQVAPDGTRYLPVTANPAYQDWFSDANWKRCTSGGVSLDVKTVALQREWLDLALLTSRSWRWLNGSPYSSVYISDGAGGATTLLPFVPDSLLLFRSLVIQVSPGVQLSVAAPRFGGWIASAVTKSPNPDPAFRWPTVKTTGRRYRFGDATGSISGLTLP